MAAWTKAFIAVCLSAGVLLLGSNFWDEQRAAGTVVFVGKRLSMPACSLRISWLAGLSPLAALRTSVARPGVQVCPLSCSGEQCWQTATSSSQ